MMIASIQNLELDYLQILKTFSKMTTVTLLRF